jgi:hypothetical protein
MRTVRILVAFVLVAVSAPACSGDGSGNAPSVLARSTTSASSFESAPLNGADEGVTPVGLSLFFRDGAIQPITLVGDAPRFLQEIDIVSSVTTPTDQGVAPILAPGVLGQVDWTGIQYIEEDWRAPGDGTWTRQRFYRGARWMQQTSVFLVVPLDASGTQVGDPITFDAGFDDSWREQADDGFVRRFVARQIVKGCQAQGDCTNATSFEVQALVQARQEQFPERRARSIPSLATQLQLVWTADPSTSRIVAVSHAQPADFPYGYGFAPSLKLVTAPSNGAYFLPGDTLSFRVAFFDGQGNQLNTPGSLPTYQQFLDGASAGIRFWDPTLDPDLYYALKHREANMILQASGPSDRLAVPQTVVGLGAFFAPQVTVASVVPDGFDAFAVVIPPLPTIVGGFSDPSLWQIPNADVQTLTVPADALSGTYTAVIKARRDWGGEALNRAATLTFQVGQSSPSAYSPTTGNCDSCHTGRSDLGIVNHGVDDRRTCFGCHPSLSFEPDNALDKRVHSIHSRSERFPADFQQCSTCHLTQPGGPARGAFVGDPDGP